MIRAVMAKSLPLAHAAGLIFTGIGTVFNAAWLRLGAPTRACSSGGFDDADCEWHPKPSTLAGPELARFTSLRGQALTVEQFPATRIGRITIVGNS